MRRDKLPGKPGKGPEEELAYYRRRVAELEEAEKRIKTIEETLRETESHLDMAQQMAHVGSWVYYVKADTSKWSDEMYRIFGISLGSPITLEKFLSFIHPDDRDKIKREIKRARKDRKLHSLDYRIVRPDGKVRTIHSERISVFTGDEPERIFGADQDVTGQRQTEEALIRSEGKCRTLVEYIGDCIWETDRYSRFTYVSPRSYDILGYTPDEILGKTPYDLMPGDAAEGMLKTVLRAKAEGKPFEVEYPFRHKKGFLVYVRVSGQPTFDSSGAFNGYIGVTSDITRRKMMEDQLKDAKEQAELYVDLLGHDINNMNQVAIGYAELALNEMRQGSCDPLLLEKTMEILYNSSRLIDNVRKIQKIKAGEVKPEEVSVSHMLREAIGRSRLILRHGDRVNCHIGSECRVMASDLLRDVFFNLISNAIKHSAEPVTIDIDIVTVRERGKNYCRVDISDNGPGIPDEKKKDLFHRFTRGTTKAKGTGLGLYLVKALVKSFNGLVWVEDRVPGDYTKGARFIVMLPI